MTKTHTQSLPELRQRRARVCIEEYWGLGRWRLALLRKSRSPRTERLSASRRRRRIRTSFDSSCSFSDVAVDTERKRHFENARYLELGHENVGRVKLGLLICKHMGQVV